MTHEKRVENITDVLIALLCYWRKKLRVPDFVIVVMELKGTESEAQVMKYEDGSIACMIDPEKFLRNRCDKHDFVVAVLHELGHIKTNSFYSAKMSPAQAEYNAETQALKWLKKYLPKRYKAQVAQMKQVLKTTPWTGKQAYYTEAFKKIKDYND